MLAVVIGNTIRLKAKFAVAENKTPLNPEGLTTPDSPQIRVRKPSGTVDVVSANVVSTGRIEGVYTPTEVGVHTARVTGLGVAEGADEEPFNVLRSAVV